MLFKQITVKIRSLLRNYLSNLILDAWYLIFDFQRMFLLYLILILKGVKSAAMVVAMARRAQG